VPDIYAEQETRGEDEFRLWLRDQTVPVLRAIIRKHDLDSARGQQERAMATVHATLETA
jgi:hypothetical protein